MANVERRVGVMARGHWFSEAALRKMLDKVPAACAREKRFVRSRVERNAKGTSRYLRENDPFEMLALEVATDIIAEKGFACFKKLCLELKKREPIAVMLTEGFIDALGFRLLQLGRKEAADVLTMNTDAYPQSAKAYERLAEAYLKTGDNESAAKFHHKALEIDPKLASSVEMLKKLTP